MIPLIRIFKQKRIAQHGPRKINHTQKIIFNVVSLQLPISTKEKDKSTIKRKDYKKFEHPNTNTNLKF